MNSRGVVMALLASGAAGLAAQTPAARPPIVAEPPAIRLPGPHVAVLANGLEVIAIEQPGQALAAFELMIRDAGGIADPPGTPGLATLTAAALVEGTAATGAIDLVRRLDTMAGALQTSAEPGAQGARITGSTLAANLPRLLALAGEVVQRPAFSAERLPAVKARLEAAAAQQRVTPGLLADEALAQLLYGHHPAARLTVTPRALAGIDREAIARFHRSMYRPDRAAIVVVSGSPAAEIVGWVQAGFGRWDRGAGGPVLGVEPPVAPEGSVRLVDRPASVQTALAVGAPFGGRSIPDFETLLVLNQLLGATPASRLFRNLRDDKGYTYGAYSRIVTERHYGHLQVTTAVRTEVTGPAMTEIMAELNRLRTSPVPEPELTSAKRALLGTLALSLESPAGQLFPRTLAWQYGLAADYWDRYADRIAAVTADQVQAAARTYLAPSRLRVAAVGDAKKVRPALETVGPVDVYTADGQRIPAPGDHHGADTR